jgi:hypothetical protein
MTADDFAAWLAHMGLNKTKASRTLGIGRNTVDRYLVNGTPDHIAYACAAIAFGLPKWSAQ